MSRDFVLEISRLSSNRIYKVAKFFTQRERERENAVKRTLICGDFIVDFY